MAIEVECWEKSMIKLNYSKEIDEEIIRHENHMLGTYVKQLQKYIVLFEEKGYDLKIGLMWKNSFEEAIEYERPNFVNGYECYVYCVVESNGEEVCVKSVDGEADYYSLSTTWMISTIVRRLFALKVLLYSDVEDADSDVFELFEQVLINDKKLEEIWDEVTIDAC